MRKIILTSILMMSAWVGTDAHTTDTLRQESVQPVQLSSQDDNFLQPLKPTFIAGAVVPSWLDNWFIAVSGGASAFIGSPVGCDDLFGRLKPALQVSIGKWHTPSVGTRLVFQGFRWESGELIEQKYRHYHADFLLNVVPSFYPDSRWDIVPFAGLGLIDNRDVERHPFAYNYGLMGRYRVAKRFYITAEISNATTFKDADGYGSSRRLGDNLLNFTAGFSVTFGRNAGWKKVVDARPYMLQNERLMARDYGLRERIRELEHQRGIDARLLAELRKILDIEGLLDKYAAQLEACGEGDTASNFSANNGYPVNDYSGLNSLRRRLREAGKVNRNHYNKGIDNGTNPVFDNGQTNDNDSVCNGILSPSSSDYWQLIKQGSECLGAPIYFFFRLGTDKLVDESQTVNLNEIVRVAGKYGLQIAVTGAADSSTGTAEINSRLGVARAKFIADYLIAHGILAEKIASRSVGGIDTYAPNEANRNASVCLYLPDE